MPVRPSHLPIAHTTITFESLVSATVALGPLLKPPARQSDTPYTPLHRPRKSGQACSLHSSTVVRLNPPSHRYGNPPNTSLSSSHPHLGSSQRVRVGCSRRRNCIAETHHHAIPRHSLSVSLITFYLVQSRRSRADSVSIPATCAVISVTTLVTKVTPALFIAFAGASFRDALCDTSPRASGSWGAHCLDRDDVRQTIHFVVARPKVAHATGARKTRNMLTRNQPATVHFECGSFNQS